MKNEVEDGYNFRKPQWSKYDKWWEIYKNEKQAYESGDFKILEFGVFSVVQSLMAILSQDPFDFHLIPTAREDIASTDILEKSLKYDFFKIQRNLIDEQNIFSTLFYSASDTLLYQYNKVRSRTKTQRDYFAPQPFVVNQRTFLYNKNAIRGQGLPTGEGAYQYAGFPTVTTKRQMEKYRGYYTFNDETFEKTYDNLYKQTIIGDIIKGDASTTSDPSKVAGAEAFRNNNRLTGPNDPIYLMHWFTFFEEQPTLTIFLGDTSNIVRHERLDFEELPFITRSLFPVTNARSFISIPYLTIDKQQGQQIVFNLALENEIKKGQGLYAIDDTRFDDYQALLSEDGGFIPLSGPVDGAIERIPQGTADSATDFILSSLQTSEQRATGITSQQRGALEGSVRSASEIQATGTSANERALTIRRRWHEDAREFILQCIRIYDNLTPSQLRGKIIKTGDLYDEEFIDLSTRSLKRIADVDVIIQDRLVEEQERIRELPYLDRLINQALSYEGTDRRELLKISARRMGIDNDDVELIYPKTAAERLAQMENNRLNRGNEVPIDELQDHRTHIRVHENAEANRFTRQHIQRHQLALVLEERRQRLAQARAQQEGQIQQPGQGAAVQAQQGQNLNNVLARAREPGRLNQNQSQLASGEIVNSGNANI